MVKIDHRVKSRLAYTVKSRLIYTVKSRLTHAVKSRLTPTAKSKLTYVVCHGAGGNALPEALQNVAHAPQQGVQVAVVEVDKQLHG